MIIGVDVRPLQGETKHRGIGKALERTLVPLSQITKTNGDSLVFFYDPALAKPGISITPSPEYIPIRTPPAFKKKYIRVALRPFKRLSVKKNVADVILQFDFSLGVPRNIPTVTAFHDLIPILFRSDELRHKANQKGLKKLKQALGGTLQWKRYTKDLSNFKHSAKIAAISQSSKNDLLRFYPELDPNLISVTHLGVDAKKLGTSSDKSLSKDVQQALDSRFLLYVGGIDTRKNIVQLLKDFYLLKKDYPDLKLVVAGKEFGLKSNLEQIGWYQELNRNPLYANDVISLGYVSDYELGQLYKKAVCFVFPSLYEGFGLPLLEAMAFQCPSVAYKNSSIVEIAGNASVLVDNGDTMSTAIKRIIEDPVLRKRLVNAGIKQVENFTWTATAEKIYKVLREASGHEQK